MYNSVEIERFRGLRHLRIPELAPVTLLTGRNNVGKTSVLEALLLHAAGPRAVQFILTALRHPPGALIELTRYSSPWDEIFYNRDSSEPVRLTANLEDHTVTVQLAVPRDEHLGSLSSSLPASASSVVSDNPYSYSLEISIISSNGQDAPDVRVFTQTVSPQSVGPAVARVGSVQQPMSITLDLKPQVNSGPVALAFFVSPQNRSPQSELAQRYSDLRRRGAESIFLDAMRAIEPSIERIEVLASGGAPLIYLSLPDSPTLPLSLLGEGMNSVANYTTSILEAAGGTVLIDEVENGIHYTALENLWQQIGRSVKETNAQVIASTHSAECVKAAYRALSGEPGMLRLLRLRSDQGSPAADTVADYDIEALEGAIDQNLEVR